MGGRKSCSQPRHCAVGRAGGEPVEHRGWARVVGVLECGFQPGEDTAIVWRTHPVHLRANSRSKGTRRPLRSPRGRGGGPSIQRRQEPGYGVALPSEASSPRPPDASIDRQRPVDRRNLLFPMLVAFRGSLSHAMSSNARVIIGRLRPGMSREFRVRWRRPGADAQGRSRLG